MTTKTDPNSKPADKLLKTKRPAPKLRSASTIARNLAEFNRWRRGRGKYAWNADPIKNVNLPFSPTELGEIIDRAVELLKGLGT